MTYKHVIRAKTRNLFDISNADITQHSGYWTSKVDFTEHFYTQIVEPGKTYTVSYECYNPAGGEDSLSLSVQTGSGFYDGTRLYTGLLTKGKYNWVKFRGVFTIPNGITQVTFSAFLLTMFRNFQLEEGSTPTPYTPYNYLQSNKRMIKVSDVCQLLDKSKYPATHTQLGCTFTNNGDGSFTINGTIQNGGSRSNPLQQITQNLYGHKILLLTNSTSDIVRGEMKFILQNGSSKGGTYNSIYTVIYDDYKYIAIRIYMDNKDTGKTIDNATVKFQLFDLTEMYGARHEPATVAEFRQRFPNELYPYSPQCWLTSYKSAVVCKTKNLFDYKTSAEKTQTNNGITLVLNADYFELSGQQQAGKYIELGQSGFNIPFEVGKTYVLSADTIVKSGGKVFMRARYTDEGSPLTEWETVSWNLFNGTIAKRFTPTRPGYLDRKSVV